VINGEQALITVPTLGFALSQYAARVYDSGDEPITATTCEAVGTAVANTLVHFKETRNRFLKIRSFETSQNEILAALEDVTSTKWDVTRLTTREIAEGRKRKLEEEKFQEAFLDLLAVQLFEDGAGRGNITELEESDNRLLSVEEVDVRDVLKNLIDIVTS
jgi:phytoene/squalene synthetase